MNDVRGNKHDGKASLELEAIVEDSVFEAKPVDKKKDLAEPKFEKMSIDEYYRFKHEHLDETESYMDQELFKEKK